ncbi:hypothetical protein OSH65_25525, partial [Mycobacterium ulcerans]
AIYRLARCVDWRDRPGAVPDGLSIRIGGESWRSGAEGKGGACEQRTNKDVSEKVHRRAFG